MDFYIDFENLLQSGDLKSCIELFYLRENEAYLNQYSWDLASLFVTYLNTPNVDKNTLEFIEAANLHLCKFNGNPRELFLIYLENTEFFFKQDINFLKLIDLIQILVLRVSPKFIYHSIEMTVNHFVKYLKNVSPTNNEKNENLDSQLRINLLYGKFVDFIQTFVDRELRQNDSFHSTKLKRFLIRVLVNLFYEPFLGVDFETNSNFSSLINKTFHLIVCLNKNVFELIQTLEQEKKLISIESEQSGEEQDEILHVNGLAISSIAFYSFQFKYNSPTPYSNSVCFFPEVYTNFYIFETFLPILTRLLMLNDSKSDSVYLTKGLLGMQILIERIANNSLPCGLLTCNHIMDFIELLFKISVYSIYESIRKRASGLLKLVFKKFNRQGRFEFLNNFLNQNLALDETINIYVCSFLVYLFKEELNECFIQRDLFYSSQYANFKYLFKLVLKLKNDVKTDLVHESAKLIACLNMLRYLVLRDKANMTGVFDLLRESPFLNELEKAAQLSKAHYELESRNLKTEPSYEVNNNVMLQVKLGFDKERTLREPSTEDRLNSLNSGLQTIDLIECLRIRVFEIIQEHEKAVQVT